MIDCLYPLLDGDECCIRELYHQIIPRTSSSSSSASLSKQAPKQEKSMLLSLPAELRNQIYEHLLIQQHHSSEASVSAPILRVNRQMYAEGMGMFYGGNTFLAHASLLAQMPSFLLEKSGGRSGGLRKQTLGRPVTARKAIGLIRKWHLVVRLDVDPRFTAMQAREDFSGAERVEIECFQATFGACPVRGVLKRFESVRGVQEAKVTGSVGDGEYASWLEQVMQSPEGTEWDPFPGSEGIDGEGRESGGEDDIWKGAWE